MPLILGGSSAAAAAFSVDNSCRFEPTNDTYLSKTPGGAGNQKTWTYSCWVKKTKAGARQGIIDVNGSSNPYFFIEFIASDKLEVQDYDGSQDTDLITTAVYRDVGAWYHICVAYDTTQAVDTNRIKVYVNGTQVTAFDTETYCAQDFTTQMNSTYELFVGRAATQDFGGYQAEVCVIDGQQLDPTSFGEFDGDSPTIFKPKSISALTAGTNGFYLDFKDSANLGNDAFGGTDLGETNLTAVDQATDSPTNNFCTINPLNNYYQNGTFSEGNNYLVSSSGGYAFSTSTMGMATGKWYWETKVVNIGAGEYQLFGITGDPCTGTLNWLGLNPYGWGIYNHAGGDTVLKNNNGDVWTDGATYTTGDILGCALDLDNNKLYFSKNDTYFNSGVPTSGATGTGAASVTAAASTTFGFYIPAFGQLSALVSTWGANFGGSPAFTVSSGNADENGYGNFEYAPPSGYYALCTKNLAEFG